jgi:predicted nuclease of predicted toxin-antitoxin system
MRFLLDMNLSPGMADWLRREGHDAVHARDIGLGTLPDRDLFVRAVTEDRILITFDLDFGDIVGAADGAGPGVLLLRLRSPRQTHMRQRVQTAIALIADALLTGAVVLVEDARIRVRSMRGEE